MGLLLGCAVGITDFTVGGLDDDGCLVGTTALGVEMVGKAAAVEGNEELEGTGALDNS